MSVKEFLKQAFCDNGTPSSSRLLTGITFLSSVLYLGYVVVKTHAFPDGMTLTGLGAYASAPYAVNRASKMFGRDKDADSNDTTVVVKNP